MFNEDEEPPFDVELFEEYFRYTYFSICQILGMEASPLKNVVPMILAVDVQTHDAQPLDYVS